MKRSVFLTLFTFSSLLVCAQTANIQRYSIPGFVQINDTLFMSKYEVSIRDYAIFLLFLNRKVHDTAKLKAFMPAPNFTDWTVWYAYEKKLIKLDGNLFFVGDTAVSFFSFTGNLPVVNIGHLQAGEYCKYKTGDYKVFYNHLNKHQKKKFPSAIFFRLPTAMEWADVSAMPVDKGAIICKNYFANDTTGEFRPMPVLKGAVNSLGIYNMAGNVAELVSDSDSVFGGSFKSDIQDCNSLCPKKFKFGDNATGFRVVAIIR